MLLDEDSDHEPDQPNEPGPGDIGPSVPEPPNPDLAERDVPKELAWTFWKLVGLFNLALLATSLGVMFVVFEGRWTLGGSIALIGVGAFVAGWRGYRRARKG